MSSYKSKIPKYSILLYLNHNHINLTLILPFLTVVSVLRWKKSFINFISIIHCVLMDGSFFLTTSLSYSILYFFSLSCLAFSQSKNPDLRFLQSVLSHVHFRDCGPYLTSDIIQVLFLINDLISFLLK